MKENFFNCIQKKNFYFIHKKHSFLDKTNANTRMRVGKQRNGETQAP